MSQDQYEMRARLPDGRWDTISHAAEALVRGSGRPSTSANIDAAVVAIARANGLQRVTITETVNSETDQRRVVVRGAGGRVISDSGWRRRPGEDILPEPGTGDTIYDCNFIDYRHANGRALSPGDDLRKPAGYTGFAPPLEQVISDCATCAPIPPVVQELTFITPTPIVREERRGDAGTVQVALPRFPDGGSPTETRAPEVLLRYNMPLLMAIMPNQPDTPARGLNSNGTGVHTVAGSLGHSAAYLASVAPLPIPGTQLGMVFFPTFMVSGPTSSDRVMQGRQGGGGAQNMEREGNRYPYESTDVAGRDGRFDGWPFNGNLDAPFGTTERTFRDGTLLPGLGIQLDGENRVVTAGDTAFGNNQLYYITGQNGAYVPSLTPSAIEQETGRRNRFVQGRPGAPEPLNFTNNYATAYFVNQQSLQPQIQMAMGAYENASDPAEKRAQAQRAIELLNYQNDLVGISNFNVNADVVGLANRGTPLTPDELLTLNPAERIAFQRESLIADAATHGITDLDRAAYPSETPVRSATREQVRDGLVSYYMEMAVGPKENEFRAVYSREVGENPSYNKNDEASVRADVARFVDGLEVVQTMPQQGFAFTNLEPYFHHPRERFSPYERQELRPQQSSGLGLRNIEPAMQVLAGDPGITGILLAASDNGDIGQAWAQFDNLRVQQPRLFSGRVHLDRGQLLAETERRGYRPELMGTTFSREETNGIIRDLPAVQEDLVRSAGNPEIVDLRRGDLIQMATNDDNWAVGKGAPAMTMLYALAQEPDSRTQLRIEEYIRANNPPEVAAQQIETLRQGVKFAEQQISREMLGTTTDEIMAANARRSLWAPGVGAAQETGSYTTTQTVAEQVIVAENVNTLFSRLAEKPPAAQAFVRATAGMGADQRSVALLSMTTLAPEQQLTLVQAAIGPNREAAAIIANSNLNAETKAAVAAAIGPNGTLNAENAGIVLNALAMVPEASTAALSAVGGNPVASTFVMNGLAANKDVASQLVGALTDAQKTDIATKANLNPNQADLWTSVAPQTVTNTVNTTVEVTRLQLPGDDISAYVAASLDPDVRNRNARMSVAFLQDPQFQGRYMREIGQANPDITIAAVIQAVAQNPALAHPFKNEMTELGGGRGGLFNTGLFGGTHSVQHQLGDAISDLAYAQSRGDQRGIARATQRIEAVATAANAGDLNARAAIADLATAMVSVEAPRGTTVTGASALSTTLTTALSVAQANPETTVINGSPITGTELITNVSTTIANTDVTNSRDVSNRGRWVVANSTSTGGWIVPWIIVPTGGKDPGDPSTNPGDPQGCVGCPRPTPPTQPTPGRPV